MSASPMHPVRPRDVAGVTWTLASAFTGARRRRRARTVLALAAAPMWVLVVGMLPGLRHGEGRRVVARIRPTSTVQNMHTLARVVAVVALVLALIVVALTLPAWAPAPQGLVSAATVTAGLLVMASSGALLAGQVTATGTPGRGSPAPAVEQGPQQRRQDSSRWKAAHWQVDCVASRLPVGGLAVVGAQMQAVAGPGSIVRAQAASGEHAALYARYGLRPLATNPLRLVGEVPVAGAGADERPGAPGTRGL